MSDLCRICGLTFSSPSFGGPGICPSCDCGISPDKDRVANLERQLADVKAQLAERTRERDEARARIPGLEQIANMRLARIESAEQQVRELREALRNRVIREAVIYDDELNEETVMRCNCCDIIWRTDQPELHAPGCLVALAPAQQEGGK